MAPCETWKSEWKKRSRWFESWQNSGEERAQTANVPRNRVFGDDALLKAALMLPKTIRDLSGSRFLRRCADDRKTATGILKAVERGVKCPKDDYPQSRESSHASVDKGQVELLKVLLKARASDAGVAQRLIATSSEVNQIAAGDKNVRALQGWRKEIFGNEALLLLRW